jgi:hypothetical protein
MTENRFGMRGGPTVWQEIFQASVLGMQVT